MEQPDARESPTRGARRHHHQHAGPARAAARPDHRPGCPILQSNPDATGRAGGRLQEPDGDDGGEDSNVLHYSGVNFNETMNYWVFTDWGHRLRPKEIVGIYGVESISNFPGNTRPIAFASNVYGVVEGDEITLDARLSFDPDGDDLMYRWDINGDAIWDTEWLPNPTYSYICDNLIQIYEGEDLNLDGRTTQGYSPAPIKWGFDSVTFERLNPNISESNSSINLGKTDH